jgi:hypothetical protein
LGSCEMSIWSLHCSENLSISSWYYHSTLFKYENPNSCAKTSYNEGQLFFHKKSNLSHHSKSKMSFERKVKEPHELVVFEILEPLPIITKWNKKDDDDDAKCANVDEIANGANDKF